MLAYVNSSLILVLLETQIKNIWHMAKVSIKNEMLTPFDGIYFTNSVFNTL